MKEMLKADKISKSFYHPFKISLLKEIDLIVNQGETVAIIGRSGQGKSTLLQILGTLDKPCKGKISIAGQKVNAFNKNGLRNQNIGFVFQAFHLMEDYTALENVLMPAKIARKNTNKGSAAYVHGFELLEKVGLADRAHFHTKLLSGGEKQRVSIARAMCNDPDIIFADEPSGNLDDETSEAIHRLLLEFAKEKNKSLVLVTHDLRLAALCDSCYQLNDGRLIN